MSQVMTASRPDGVARTGVAQARVAQTRVAPTRVAASRVCPNTALNNGVRPVSPAGAPVRKPQCDRARIKTVQPDLPQVSGASALLAAMLLVAIAFGVLLLGSWRQSSVSGASEQQEAVAQVAGLVARADGTEGPGGE